MVELEKKVIFLFTSFCFILGVFVRQTIHYHLIVVPRAICFLGKKQMIKGLCREEPWPNYTPCNREGLAQHQIRLDISRNTRRSSTVHRSLVYECYWFTNFLMIWIIRFFFLYRSPFDHMIGAIKILWNSFLYPRFHRIFNIWAQTFFLRNPMHFHYLSPHTLSLTHQSS